MSAWANPSASANYPPTGSGFEPIAVEWRLVVRAKRLMRAGLDLYEAATALGVRARDLDASLWRQIGSGGWV